VRVSQLDFKNERLKSLCVNLSSIDRRLDLIRRTCEKGIMPPMYWIYEVNWKIEQVIRMIAGLVPSDVQKKVEMELKTIRENIVKAFEKVMKGEDKINMLLWSLNEYYRFTDGFLYAWLDETRQVSKKTELLNAIEILLRMLRVERVPKIPKAVEERKKG